MFGFWGLLHKNIFCLGLHKFLIIISYVTVPETVVECTGMLPDTCTAGFDSRAIYKNLMMDRGKNLTQKLKSIGFSLKALKYNQ